MEDSPTGTTWRDDFANQPGHEILTVDSNSSLEVKLLNQDTLILHDREGDQPIMIIAESDDLTSSALDYNADAPKADITQPILDAMTPGLMSHHIDKIKSMTSPQIMQFAEREAQLCARKDISLIIVSAARPDAGRPPGPIDLYLKRQNKAESH